MFQKILLFLCVSCVCATSSLGSFKGNRTEFYKTGLPLQETDPDFEEYKSKHAGKYNFIGFDAFRKEVLKNFKDLEIGDLCDQHNELRQDSGQTLLEAQLDSWMSKCEEVTVSLKYMSAIGFRTKKEDDTLLVVCNLASYVSSCGSDCVLNKGGLNIRVSFVDSTECDRHLKAGKTYLAGENGALGKQKVELQGKLYYGKNPRIKHVVRAQGLFGDFFEKVTQEDQEKKTQGKD